MIPWIAAGFIVAGFVVLGKLFGLVEKSGSVISLSRSSLGVVRNAGLSDEAKEAALQENAKRLFRLAFSLAFGAAVAVLSPTGLVWLCDRLGWISLASVCDVMISPSFIAISGIVVAAMFVPFKSKEPRKVGDYSATDRLLHRVAFKTYAAQIAVADIEDRIFAKQLACCKIDRPVFITAIPRAGTTMLLEICAGMKEFASHCYRDMPFVLIPCLWNRFSIAFRRHVAPHERAHGDGMMIDFDSPEALEEVLWKTFWRRHYGPDRIVPWKSEEWADADEFGEFFRSHMRKVMLVRRGKDASMARYVSKNNLNIARTAILHKLFPDAVVVVPFREPLQHAESLLKQHRNFLRIHKEDRFASEYMRAIGHYDFGENLRPVDFDGWLDRRESERTDCLAFWLEYWVASYRHLLEEQADSVHFVDYDALCENPDRGLRLVADALGCREPDALFAAGQGIHAARPRTVDVGTVPASILHETNRILAALKSRAGAE